MTQLMLTIGVQYQTTFLNLFFFSPKTNEKTNEKKKIQKGLGERLIHLEASIYCNCSSPMTKVNFLIGVVD